MRFQLSTARTYAIRSALVALGTVALVTVLRYVSEDMPAEVTRGLAADDTPWRCRIHNQSRFTLLFPLTFFGVMIVVGPLLGAAREQLGWSTGVVVALGSVLAIGMLGAMAAYLLLPQGDIVLRGGELAVEARFREPVRVEVEGARIDLIRWQRRLEGTGPYTVGPILRIRDAERTLTIGAPSKELVEGLPEDAGQIKPPSYTIDPEDFRELVQRLEAARR